MVSLHGARYSVLIAGGARVTASLRSHLYWFLFGSVFCWGRDTHGVGSRWLFSGLNVQTRVGIEIEGSGGQEGGVCPLQVRGKPVPSQGAGQTCAGHEDKQGQKLRWPGTLS